jgi:hypothetical protein
MIDWQPINTCPENDTVFFAAYYVPSEEAARNGATAFWNYGCGSKLRRIYTGILGHPSHWAAVTPPDQSARVHSS